MTEGTIRPNVDGGTIEWTTYGGSGDHYTRVDEEVLDINDAVYVTGSGSNGYVEIFGFGTISGTYTISKIVLWLHYFNSDSSEGTLVNVSFDGGSNWEGEQELPASATTDDYYLTWDGLSYDQDDLENLVVKFTANIVDKYAQQWVYQAYVVVTYEEPSGYGNNVIGVVHSNIGKVIGVDTENIDKVIGV